MKFKDVVRVVATKHKQLEPTALPSVVWAEIAVKGRPTKIELVIQPLLNVYTLFVKDGVSTEANKFALTVPVTWKEQIPRTRSRGKDNVDMVLVYPDGSFIDVQVSLVTRGGQFFTCVQQVYSGWVLRIAGTEDYDVRPSDAIHGYPSADFKRSFSTVFEALKQKAKEIESGADITVDPVHWTPPEVKPREDSHRGVVQFFNAVTGMGFIQDLDQPDDQLTFVHFSDIKGGEDFPILLPMEGVYFNRKDQGGQVKAINVSLAESDALWPKQPSRVLSS